MKEPEMEMIAGLIINVLKKPNNDELIEKVRAEVSELCRTFPLYIGYDF
jgi:glycine hydroxymethyltransferase